MAQNLRIGVDVGGTNTDAVLMDGDSILETCKTPTTHDIGSGIVSAIRELLHPEGTHTAEVRAVMIGTTQFTNTFVQARGLARVGVLRLSLPASASLLPLAGWPPVVADAVRGVSVLVPGGYEFDGREISSFDERAVRDAARQFRDAGLTAVAISCPFSSVRDDMEVRARQIVAEELPDAAITMSSEIGSTGLLARENAAIINASLARLAEQIVDSFQAALDSLGIEAPLFVSQNDGTLMNAGFTKRFPVLTFASGPTNSMRGAALLSGCTDGIVIDIGGTTTDVGVLQNGFPRHSSEPVRVGGVYTNFRMPDLLSVALGGGSVVRREPELSVGPASVGLDIVREALVFGGHTLTATDVVVALGAAEVGERSKVAHLEQEFLECCRTRIQQIIVDTIDRVKTRAENQPVILVGGGSILVTQHLEGAGEQILPPHSNVANAVGAGIAQVGGEVDRVYSFDQLSRDAALDMARTEAIEQARQAGARQNAIDIVSVEEVPLAYMPGGSVRVRVKAVGDLDLDRFSGTSS